MQTVSDSSVAVGLAIDDGLLALDDRVVDVLSDHVPDDVSDQGRRITVRHLLSMTAGHPTDSLDGAWQQEPSDLIKGFLRVPFTDPEATPPPPVPHGQRLQCITFVVQPPWSTTARWIRGQMRSSTRARSC